MKSIDNSLLKLRRYLIDCFVIREKQIELNGFWKEFQQKKIRFLNLEFFVNLPQIKCAKIIQNLCKKLLKSLQKQIFQRLTLFQRKLFKKKNSLAICVSAHFEKFFININYVAKFSLYRIFLNVFWNLICLDKM